MASKVFLLAMISIVCLVVLETSAAPTSPSLPKCLSIKEFRMLPPAAIRGMLLSNWITGATKWCDDESKTVSPSGNIYE
ncbi:hypothetical protein ALC56_10366 [Trachymyrmex septentrionalis]|uniref:Uncharacterized protein n=1 Tax=Trachymyrmex septentrionalis TaxID=34720 RepID=A0A195F4U6_9HYME|nr:hypothetical protein ALC56_10366 [Trachymyrmex septentrionalis]